jgi:NADH dehydrogenase FAD-containing subunit
VETNQKVTTGENNAVLPVSGTEASLRKEIARKNLEGISREENYLMIDGHQLEDNFELAVNITTGEITRAVKQRAFPLFMMEKAAMLVDEAASILSKLNQDEDTKDTVKTKERLVILGTGWGAASFVKSIDTSMFDVTVVSPRNYFLFTPMLAGAAVGTVNYRSITQPIRQVNPNVQYLEATANNIDPDSRTITCESVTCMGNSCTIDEFKIEYDRLLVSVGAQTNTFGIPGVREHCCFLKQVEDAKRIRVAIVNCFERASFPNLTDEDREQILTFCVVGAGPTGVEFASELRDFVEEDGPKFYPKLLKHVRIKVIEASNTILGPFDKSLQKAAIDALERRVSIKNEEAMALLPNQFKFTELLLESGVQEVTEKVIKLNNGKEIPYGIAVWAAGIGPLPVTLQLIDALKGTEQEGAQAVARGRLAVDPWLRVYGGKGRIMALGDCSCNPEYQLPATAQVAGQQGEHLSKLLSNKVNMTNTFEGKLLPATRAKDSNSLMEKVAAFSMNSGTIAAPFQFWNLGILAYTGGGSALAQLQVNQAKIKGRGKVGFGLWRSVYLTKQVSFRNRVLVALDWVKTRAFGRDITQM